MFDANKKVLENGITLISIKKDTALSCVNIGVNVGSLYEDIKEKGISHFVEHMLFKGTKKRDNYTLNLELENLGGEYNAYTDNNSTVLTVTSLSEELNSSIEILSDMLQNSIFPKSEIKKEKDVILAEIRNNRDDIEDFSFTKVSEIAFKNSPLKYDILGSEKDVKKYDEKLLTEFYNKYYIPNNCYISIVSPFSHEYVQEIVDKYFKNWERKKLYKKDILNEENIEIKKVSYKKDIEQSTVIYLYTFYGLSKKEELALKILNHRLGESTNSVLFRELREKRGFAYDVYTDLDLSPNVKTLCIYASISKENLDDTLKVIDKCVDDVKKEKIQFNEDTTKLMKKVLKTAIAFTLEDASDLGNYVLHQSIDGENLFQFYEDIKELSSVEKKDIYNVSKKVFNNPSIHILLND